MNTIDIALSFNKKYAPYAMTLMLSILDNTQHKIQFYVLQKNLEAETKEIVSHFLEQHNSSAIYLDVAEEDISFYTFGTIHESAIYRIFLPELLPHNSRIIYLDCDILCTGDIQELWDIDLKGLPIAAVNEHKKDRDHLNSGVLVMDLDKMRALDIHNTALSFLKNKQALEDETALNLSAIKQTHFLHPKFNFFSTYFRFIKPRLLFSKWRTEILEAKKQPVLIHFIANKKPNCLNYNWKHPLGSFKENQIKMRFIETLSRTPLKEDLPIKADLFCKMFFIKN